MTLWIDQKYLNLVSFRFDGFVQKKRDLWNARCVFCGDSELSKRKKRFYVYPGKDIKSDNLFCSCHNCGWHGGIGKLLEAIDPPLHREYIFERVKEKNRARTLPDAPKRTFVQQASTLPTVSDDILESLPRINQLHSDHSAYRYCIDRRLPDFALNEFRWSDDFKATASLLNPESAADLRENDARIVIPFYDEDGDVSLFQGRTIEAGIQPKYITIKANDSIEKVYGMNRLDKTKPVIVVEGPVDSLFVENAIATGDSDLTRYPGAASYVFDMQPRNRAIVSKIESAVNNGHPVFISPPSFQTNAKDINDLVLERYQTPQELAHFILSNTLKGFQARMAFASWRRIS